jgi:hypothetical protein
MSRGALSEASEARSGLPFKFAREVKPPTSKKGNDKC